VNVHLPTDSDSRTPPTARQEEILERAAELVQEAGLANLTLKKVADRVGFTEAAIYRHFPHKKALIFAMIDRLGERLLGPISVLAAERDRAPRARLLDMVGHHVHVLRRTQGLPILLMAEGLASGDAELVEHLGGVMRRYLGLLAGVLTELRLPLALPADRQAALFIGLPAALGMQMRAFPDLAPSDAELDELVRYYVHALTRPAAPAPQKEVRR